MIEYDKRLLKNFYLNKGYFNIVINSSFAKLINDQEFELVFNIKSGDKYFFNDVFFHNSKLFKSANFYFG